MSDGKTFLDMGDEPNLGQRRMADRFAYMHAGRMVHVDGLGWHAWDGTRWVASEGEVAEYQAVTEVLDESQREIDRLGDGADKDLVNGVRQGWSAKGIAGILRVAQDLPGATCSVKALDSDPWLLNTPSGVLDLRTGAVRSHDPKDRITKMTTVGLAPEGTEAPVFTRFIERILPNPEVREFMQRLLGYSLLGEVREHVLPIWIGDGANGKGVLRDIVRHVIGDYGIEVDTSILMPGRRHPTEWMDLLGVRFAACGEAGRGSRLSESALGRAIGGGPIQARRMRQATVEFAPSHTIMMLANHVPKVPSRLQRCVLVVPFDTTIPAKERDPGLKDKLRAEAPDVMSWLWQGWLSYREQGLNPPAAVRTGTGA